VNITFAITPFHKETAFSSEDTKRQNNETKQENIAFSLFSLEKV